MISQCFQCLVSLLSCDGWEISTIEHLGNKRDGLDPLQSSMVQHNASQCGFCTPGFIMSTNTLLLSDESPSKKQIEDQVVGNICRCTGYRPILDALKSMSDSSQKKKVVDIEDLSDWVKVCPLNKECKKKKVGDKAWFKPSTISSLLDYLDKLPDHTGHKMIAGNTARGVYEDLEDHDALIDVTDVTELKQVSSDPLEVGAALSITDTINHFKMILENEESGGYSYLKIINDYLVYVASPAIRDVGTMAGNIMMKVLHPSFQSDIFSMLEAVGAKVVIASLENGQIKLSEYSPVQLLNLDMKKKVIVKIIFPKLTSQHKFQYYKVAPRTAFAAAYVNAAFLAEFDQTNKIIVSPPSLVFGGVSDKFIHASDAETMIAGKDLTNPEILKNIFTTLDREAATDSDIEEQEFKTKLPSSLFYKFLLDTLGEEISDNKRSGSGKVSKNFVLKSSWNFPLRGL